MTTILHGRPPIEIGGEWRTKGQSPQEDVEVRVAYSLLNLESNVHYHDNVILTQFRVSKTKEGWYVMLKGTRRGKKLVAFLGADDYRDAVTIAATSTDCQYVPWSADVWKPG